jgi:hypothetical protein
MNDIVYTECGRTWFERSERWRAYVAAHEEASEVGLFCPECVAREFLDESSAG